MSEGDEFSDGLSSPAFWVGVLELSNRNVYDYSTVKETFLRRAGRVPEKEEGKQTKHCDRIAASLNEALDQAESGRGYLEYAPEDKDIMYFKILKSLLQPREYLVMYDTLQNLVGTSKNKEYVNATPVKYREYYQNLFRFLTTEYDSPPTESFNALVETYRQNVRKSRDPLEKKIREIENKIELGDESRV